ncbi:MAG: hypothetical protein IH600_16280 [Bacteroidetes bacterium]|nr:hypothetical protein [Bacteroidota bacterium]
MIEAIDRRRAIIPLLFAFVLLAPAAQLAAQESPLREERGSVTYVTSTMVYGDLGRRNGLREGDTVFVSDNKGEIASVRVLHLASKSFSGEIIERKGSILQGHALLARVRGIVIPDQPPVLTDTIKAPVAVRSESTTPVRTEPTRGSRPTAETETQLRGRIALQYYAMNSSTATNGLVFSQPAAVLNFTADHLFSMPLQFSYYSNHRYDARGDAARNGVSQDRLRNRFYQLSLQYGGDDLPYTAVVGRFVPYQVGGIGTVDGAMLAGRSGDFEGGIIAGSQPGYTNSEISLQDQKVAAFAGYTGGTDTWQLRSNLAFAQTYRDGAVDRGYFYLVNSMSFGGAVTLYQNATLDLYDADRGNGRSQPHLTDLYLSATWRPERWLSLSGSFADRRSVFFLRSFAALPDSLFNTSRLQNYQVSAGVNIPGGMYASLTASVRTQETSGKAATAYSGRYTWSNFLASRVNIYLLGSYADNLFNTSRSLGFEANRDLIEGLYAALRLQQFRYVYTQNNRALDRISVATDLYYRLGGLWYLSLNYERYWEGGIASDRIYTEISMRLR